MCVCSPFVSCRIRVLSSFCKSLPRCHCSPLSLFLRLLNILAAILRCSFVCCPLLPFIFDEFFFRKTTKRFVWIEQINTCARHASETSTCASRGFDQQTAVGKRPLHRCRRQHRPMLCLLPRHLIEKKEQTFDRLRRFSCSSVQPALFYALEERRKLPARTGGERQARNRC